MSVNSSLQRSKQSKKWVQIFDERVEYKLQTKTYRISNQKFNKQKQSRNLDGSIEPFTLPPINTSSGYQSKSPSHASVGIGASRSFSHDFHDDSISVLTEGSPSNFHRLTHFGPGHFGYQPSISLTLPGSVDKSSMVVLRDCKHTAENLVPPPKQMDWSVSWGSQLLCYLCNEPAINDCTICKKCNMVAHQLCIVEGNLKENSRNNPILGLHHAFNPLKIQTSLRQSFTGADQIINHKCLNCEEAYHADLKYYEKLILRIKEEQQMHLSATRIGYRALIFIEKCRLMKKKKKIIKIQAIVRGVLVRKHIQQMIYKKQIKIIILQFLLLPHFLMNQDCIIIITTHDTFKNSQFFRFDKDLSNVFNEVILIPGFSWYQTLIITIGIKEVNTGSYSLIGQAQLSLRDIAKMSRRIDVTLNFLERITWMPQDVPGIKSPPLTVPFRLVPIFAESNDFQVKFRFMPQNPVTSFCQTISAPPLDILRRPAELGMKKKRRAVAPSALPTLNPNASMTSSMTLGPSVSSMTTGAGSSSVTYRNSRYWLCLHQLKLWFYQYYGDAVPRFASDVAHATVTVMKDKGRATSLVTLIHADQRTWVLEFGDKREATKFETALNESKKAFFEGRSIYARKEDMFETFNFGFNLTIY